MTIIIAQKITTGVLVSADNTMSAGSILVRRASPKLSSLGSRVVAGFAGLVRLNNIAQHDVRNTSPDDWNMRAEPGALFPTPRPGETPDDYERELGAYFRALMKDEPSDVSFYGLVCLDREIFRVGPKGSVTRVLSAYDAIGLAETVALGAFFATKSDEIPDHREAFRRAEIALEACAEHVEGIRPPWIHAQTIARA